MNIKLLIICGICVSCISCENYDENSKPYKCGHNNYVRLIQDTTIWFSENRIGHILYFPDGIVKLNLHYLDDSVIRSRLMFTFVDNKTFFVKIVPGYIPEKSMFQSNIYEIALFKNDILVSLSREPGIEITQHNYRKKIEENLLKLKFSFIKQYVVGRNVEIPNDEYGDTTRLFK